MGNDKDPKLQETTKSTAGRNIHDIVEHFCEHLRSSVAVVSFSFIRAPRVQNQ